MTKGYDEIILEEARRAIDKQVASVDEIRSRTGLLLATATVTASVLGSVAASTGGLGFLGLLGTVSYVVSVFCCLAVLRVRPDSWVVVTSPDVLIKEWIETERPEHSMTLYLALALESHYDENKKVTDDLFEWFGRAAIAVGAAVILGVAQLAING